MNKDHSQKNIICDKCSVHCCKNCILLNPYGRQTCFYCLKKFFPNYSNYIKIKDEIYCGTKY